MGEWRDFALAHAHFYRERAHELDAAYSTKNWRRLLDAMLPELDNMRAAGPSG
jgi:hypothetical protein